MSEEKCERSLLQMALDWHEKGDQVAIATVISTWGSSPRAVGSQLIVNSDRRFEGSVSGGCVESAVIEKALHVIDTSKSCAVAYGVSNEQAWEVGLACGGKIEIYIEPLISNDQETPVN